VAGSFAQDAVGLGHEFVATGHRWAYQGRRGCLAVEQAGPWTGGGIGGGEHGKVNYELWRGGKYGHRGPQLLINMHLQTSSFNRLG